MPLSLDDFLALPVGTLVVNKYGDHGILRSDQKWHFYETAALGPQYVFKHNSPMEVVSFSSGERVRTPEEAESLPVGTRLMLPNSTAVTRLSGSDTPGGTWETAGGDVVVLDDRLGATKGALVFSLPTDPTRERPSKRRARTDAKRKARGQR